MNVTGMNLILAHPNTKKKVDVFALSIYGLIIFPKVLGDVDEKVDKVSYRVFSESYSPLKELATTPRHDDIIEERWITILQNLHDEDIE
ncbi:hypothetical protein Gotur_026218 [Gossypium turneri]